MSNTCTDIESIQVTYLDGELEDADLREFEGHIADCKNCQEQLEVALTSHTELRNVLRNSPVAPDHLMDRVTDLLDKEDAVRRQQQRRRWLNWSMPATASVLAVAALALFVWNDLIATNTSSVARSSQITRDAARQHFQETPLFVSGDRNTVGVGATNYLDAPVTAPRFSTQEVRLLGWSPTQIGGKQSATFVYEVVDRTGRHEVRVNVLASHTLNLATQHRMNFGGTPYWVDHAYGFNTVTVTSNAVAYVFSSDLSVESLLSLVTQTDIVNTLGRRLGP